MIVLDVEQGSKEWLAARRGIPTASEFKRIITPAKADYSADADLYAADLLAESLGCYRKTAEGVEDVERGHRLEDEARRWLKLRKGWKIEQLGFCLSDCRRYGYSPDGHLPDTRILEIKAPDVKTLIKWKLKGGIPREHLPQVHGGMVVTGAPGAVFCAYSEHPLVDNMVIEVEPDNYTKKVRECVLRFCDRLDEIRELILGDEYAVLFPEQSRRNKA